MFAVSGEYHANTLSQSMLAISSMWEQWKINLTSTRNCSIDSSVKLTAFIRLISFVAEVVVVSYNSNANNWTSWYTSSKFPKFLQSSVFIMTFLFNSMYLIWLFTLSFQKPRFSCYTIQPFAKSQRQIAFFIMENIVYVDSIIFWILKVFFEILWSKRMFSIHI